MHGNPAGIYSFSALIADRLHGWRLTASVQLRAHIETPNELRIELQLNGKVQVVIRIRTTPPQDNSPPCR